MVAPQSVSLAQVASSSQLESKAKANADAEQSNKLLQLLQNNIQGIMRSPQAAAKLAQLAPALQ